MRKCVLLLALLGGCASNDYSPSLYVTSQTQTSVKKGLEEVLFDEASSGKIKMPIEKACLIAGGCDDLMVDFYERKFNELALEITQGARGNDLEKAIYVSGELSKRTKFVANEYQFQKMLNLGSKEGNCVLHSIVLQKSFDLLGIKSGIIANRTHQFNYIDFNGRKYVDATSPETGFIAGKEEIDDEESHKVSKEETVSNIYAVRASVVDFSGNVIEAEEIYEKGLKIYPKNQVILEDLYRLHRYFDLDKTIRDLDRYIDACPQSSALHVHKARVLVELNKYNLAVEEMDRAILIDPEDKEMIEERGKYILEHK